ncbi:MAG: toll/interleukin-1 receptor domain-containing protein [Candidatus Aminicenantes bacterium]|nr:MAG: toll/interleukin-1 receptor domain-containing protein [Candidatus Aminicenantes bacterium]
MGYDVFISHASEDKEDVARPLAAHLKEQGLSVWLDEFELTLGDSLRRSIDRGLSKSRFGVVILSTAFFSKEWPNRELDGLVAREENIGKVILPIWHNVSRDEVLKFSPTLADRLAVSTSRGIRHVAKQIISAVARAANNDDIKFKFREKDLLKELREKMIVARSPMELRMVVYELEEYLSKYPNSSEARLFEYQIKNALEKEENRKMKVKYCYCMRSRLFVILAMLLSMILTIILLILENC